MLCAKNGAAEQHRQKKESAHCCYMGKADAQDSHANPKDDKAADHEAPDPVPQPHDPARRKCPIINHDGGPTDELQYVEQGKENPPAPAKRHFDRLHRAPTRLCTNDPCGKEQGTAYDMSKENGDGAPCETEWCKIGACQYLRK